MQLTYDFAFVKKVSDLSKALEYGTMLEAGEWCWLEGCVKVIWVILWPSMVVAQGLEKDFHADWIFAQRTHLDYQVDNTVFEKKHARH